MKETIQLGCVSQECRQKVHSAGNWKIGIDSHRQVLQGHDASRTKFWREKGPSQGVMQKCESKKGRKTKPSNKSDVPAENHGTCRKMSLTS